MSQTMQIRLSSVEEWLGKETTSVLKPLKDKADSLLKEVRFRVDDTTQSGQKILENSESEMNKNNAKTYRFARNANRFAENLLGTTHALVFPDDHTYEKLNAFCGDLEKACANLEMLRRGGYPYISPYFIFDRRRLDVSLKRLFDITKEFRMFLTTKYAKAKTVEDVNTIIKRLHQTLSEIKQAQNEAAATEERKKGLEQKITEAKREFADVESRPELNELLKLNAKIDELRQNVKHNLRYLQKPFFKLQSLARVGEVTIPLDDMNRLGDYLGDPFLALANEEDSYPSLRSLVEKLDNTIARSKLKLKSTRLRKAQDQIRSILSKGSLNSLQKDCKATLSQQRQLLTSETVSNLQVRLSQLDARLKELQKENEAVRFKSQSLENHQAKLRERVEYLKKDSEKGILETTGKTVQIVLDL